MLRPCHDRVLVEVVNEAVEELASGLLLPDTVDPETGANLGAEKVRLSVTLDPGGDSYHAVGTLEHTHPDGSLSGQAGPATGFATRMAVEAPGTPVMTVPELFGAEAATPEATPEP